jgi:hypothetical protein
MQWARPETFEGQHGMPRTLLARRGPSHTSPRTNSVRPPMRSRPHVLPSPKARARPQGDWSANGSVTNSRRPFASSCLTTSVCGMTSAGQRLTTERPWPERFRTRASPSPLSAVETDCASACSKHSGASTGNHAAWLLPGSYCYLPRSADAVSLANLGDEEPTADCGDKRRCVLEGCRCHGRSGVTPATNRHRAP